MKKEEEKKELTLEKLKKQGEEDKSSSSPFAVTREVEEDKSSSSPFAVTREGEEDKSSSPPSAIARELKECQKRKDEYLAGWQRERADFLNYKKEEMERVGELSKYANIGLILRILPILDNFDLIEKKLPENLKNDENVKGILKINTQIKDFLKSQGVELIESLGKKFDPNFHEVVKEIKVENKEPGTIIEEVQRGYLIQGKILRPAKVKVSK